MEKWDVKKNTRADLDIVNSKTDAMVAAVWEPQCEGSEAYYKRANLLANAPAMERVIKKVLNDCRKGQYAELPQGTIDALKAAIKPRLETTGETNELVPDEDIKPPEFDKID